MSQPLPSRTVATAASDATPRTVTLIAGDRVTVGGDYGPVTSIRAGALVIRFGDQAFALLFHPRSGTVSLRARAEDEAGRSVEQTIVATTCAEGRVGTRNHGRIGGARARRSRPLVLASRAGAPGPGRAHPGRTR